MKIKTWIITFSVVLSSISFAKAQIPQPTIPAFKQYQPISIGQNYTNRNPGYTHQPPPPSSVSRKETSAQLVKEALAEDEVYRARYHPVNMYADPAARAEDPMFENAFQLLRGMLEQRKYNFKDAVFITEKAFDPNLDYEQFDREIQSLTGAARQMAGSQPQYGDDPLLITSWAIKHYMVDSLPRLKEDGLYNEVTFTYDFEDIFGEEDTRQMFVSKLLRTRQGNCHSMPYLYKIVAQELGYGNEAHLAYAPNHVYIRLKLDGLWWNLELTNGHFEQDYFMMATGYVHVPGIQGRIYMTPLSEQESIAACVMDLALYYESKYGMDNFVYKCTQLARQYYPNCIQACQVEANYWNAGLRYQAYKKGYTTVEEVRQDEHTRYLLEKIETLTQTMDGKGYIEVPEWKYLEWIESMRAEKERRSGFK